MECLLVRISKEYERLQENNNTDRLLEFGRCDDMHHFKPQYTALTHDYMPSHLWNNKIMSLPWYLKDLEKQNKEYDACLIKIY